MLVLAECVGMHQRLHLSEVVVIVDRSELLLFGGQLSQVVAVVHGHNLLHRHLVSGIRLPNGQASGR